MASPPTIILWRARLANAVLQETLNGDPSGTFGIGDASRGREGLSWKGGTIDCCSGFDPFLLDSNIEQSNPSGLAALRLDDQVLESSRGTLIHVRSVMFPVRFGCKVPRIFAWPVDWRGSDRCVCLYPWGRV